MKRLLIFLAYLNFVACTNTVKKQEAVSSPKVQDIKTNFNKTDLDDLDLAISKGDLDLIKKTAGSFLQENPKNLKALNAMAMYYYQKKQYKASTLLLDKYMNYSKVESPMALNNIALVAIANDEKRQAMLQFKRAWSLNPENELISNNLASIYLKEHDYDKAKVVLEKLALQNQLSLNGKNNYAIALVATGKLTEAEEMYNGILQIDVNNKSALYNLAILYIDKLSKPKDGLDLLNRLKFVGGVNEYQQRIKELENKAKEGLK